MYAVEITSIVKKFNIRVCRNSKIGYTSVNVFFDKNTFVKKHFFFYVHTRTEHKNRLQVESNSAIKYRFYILDLISKKQQLTVQII